MRKRWIGYLLVLFALLWAKLPGLSTQEEFPEFRCEGKSLMEEGSVLKVSAKATTDLSWLSKRIGGITIQRVKPQPVWRVYC